jgi:hypothetical protein
MTRLTRTEVLKQLLSVTAATRRDLDGWFGSTRVRRALDDLKDLGIVKEADGTGMVWVTRWDGSRYV